MQNIMKTKRNLALASSRINNHLNPNSTLSIISYADHPPQTPLKSFSVLTVFPRVAFKPSVYVQTNVMLITERGHELKQNAERFPLN